MYFGQLVRGDFRDDVRDRLASIIHGMRDRAAIDAVILGGTELPLILREPEYGGVPVLDSTGVHVEAALDWLLGSDQDGSTPSSAAGALPGNIGP